MSQNNQYRRGHGRAAHLSVALIGILFFILAFYWIKEGAFHDILINLSAGFISLAILYWLVKEFLSWEPVESQLQGLSENIQNATEQAERLNELLTYAKVQQTPSEAYKTLIKNYRLAKKQVNFIAWHDILDKSQQAEGKEYFEEAMKFLFEVPYTRILLWAEEHVDFLEYAVQHELLDPKFEIRFFVSPESPQRPLLPCAIVDQDWVSFGWGYLGRPRMSETNIALRYPDVVKAFADYFEDLWVSDDTVEIKKPGETLDTGMIDKLKTKLARRKEPRIRALISRLPLGIFTLSSDD